MAEDQSQEQEKSHAATPGKIRKAREKGDIPVSTETHTAAAYVGLMIGLAAGGGWSVEIAGARFKAFLARPETFLDASRSGDAIWRAAMEAGLAFAPIVFFPMAMVLVSLFAQQAVVFAPSKLQPKFSRLSLVQNAKQKFGPKGFSEFVRSFLKLSFVLLVAGVASLAHFMELPGLAGLAPTALGGVLLRQALMLIGLFTLAAAIIAAIDLPWRRYEHAKRQRMSVQELKEETKESEGDPHMRQARRDRGRETAMRRQMLEVPKADVILVNPTHYAVALKWEREKGGAPVCVAKGVDEVARRIRELAAEHGVPIKRDPPTARSIFDLVDVGEQIRREHYAAVAAAIHFAEEMRKKSKSYLKARR